MKDEFELLRFRLQRLKDCPPHYGATHEMIGQWMIAIGHINIEMMEMMIGEPNESNKGNGSEPIRP